MKPAAAKAYVRQLCSLGLGGQGIIPELLKALAAVIPSGPNAFVGLNAQFEHTYAILENPVPSIMALFVEEKNGAFRRELEISKNWWRSPPEPVFRMPNPLRRDFYRDDFYNHLWRPSGQHNSLEGLVSEFGKPCGTVQLFRANGERPFSDREVAELACLLPHIAHALNARPAEDLAFVDTGCRGHAILDSSGRITHQSEAAKRLLYLATDPQVSAAGPPAPSVEMLLNKMVGDLSAIARGRDAPPPVVSRPNPWGRFVFRASYLNNTVAAGDGLTLVTVEHQEPLQLRLLQGLRNLSLSGREREVCFWLAQGLSQTEVGKRLHIKPGTVKEYADSAYLKLGIHSRAELSQRILGASASAL